jgi:excisionase family DNA binding protein
MEPDYLTLPEAAQLMRTTESALYQWRHHKTGPPSMKVGRRVLYRRESLLAWLSERECAA